MKLLSIKILIYSVIFMALFAISSIILIEKNNFNIYFTVASSLILTLYLYGVMNLISVRELISGFYFKENSFDFKMKLISYMIIFHTCFQQMFISIIYNYVVTQKFNIVDPLWKTFVLYFCIIIFLFAMAIRTKSKNEV